MSSYPYRLSISTGRGENALKSGYLYKAILLLEAEIELLKFSFLQTKHNPDKTESHSQVYFVPHPEGLGYIGMGEIATSLQLTGEFFDEKGNPAALSHISNALESVFHYISDIYKSKSTIYRRKPYNRTKALDYLKNLIIREGRKKKDEKR